MWESRWPTGKLSLLVYETMPLPISVFHELRALVLFETFFASWSQSDRRFSFHLLILDGNIRGSRFIDVIIYIGEFGVYYFVIEYRIVNRNHLRLTHTIVNLCGSKYVNWTSEMVQYKY